MPTVPTLRPAPTTTGGEASSPKKEAGASRAVATGAGARVSGSGGVGVGVGVGALGVLLGWWW